MRHLVEQVRWLQGFAEAMAMLRRQAFEPANWTTCERCGCVLECGILGQVAVDDCPRCGEPVRSR